MNKCNILCYFQDAGNRKQSSDTLLIHLVNSVNKLMTQHAVDILKLEVEMDKRFQKLVKTMKFQGKDIKKLQEQNKQDTEELKKVKAENIKLQKQQMILGSKHLEDITKINTRQNELEKKHSNDIKEINSKFPSALVGIVV